MATCPVCRNKSAEISSSKRIPGQRDSSWFVKCPTCPIPFEIPGRTWNLAITDPDEMARRRPQWEEFLRRAAEKGDYFTKLY